VYSRGFPPVRGGGVVAPGSSKARRGGRGERCGRGSGEFVGRGRVSTRVVVVLKN